ncbi:MAG: hypothetical protein IKU15_00245 [Clostridia bacterium]|nr:hypothetical protein [Clostridia bacterium]
MANYNITAEQIRIAKLEADAAELFAKQKKDAYEALRRQLVSDMVTGNTFKFEIFGTEQYPGMSFRLETKKRWSPVVDNKDQLIEKLRQNAPELFTITPAALTKYMNDIVEANGDSLPSEYNGLVKDYDDTHVVVRTTKK